MTCDKCYKKEGHFESCPKYGEELIDFLMGFGKKAKPQWEPKAANEPDWVKRIRELNDKMKRQ